MVDGAIKLVVGRPERRAGFVPRVVELIGRTLRRSGGARRIVGNRVRLEGPVPLEPVVVRDQRGQSVEQR